jgi:hypothetical protein
MSLFLEKPAMKKVGFSKAYRQRTDPTPKVQKVLSYPHFSGRQIAISHSSDHYMRGFPWLALVHI